MTSVEASPREVESSEISQAPPLLFGYLRKLGERGIKTFKKRYFRQSGLKVSYYETENDKIEHSKGFINLEQIQEVRKSSAHPNSFELVSKENKRTYVLQVCEVGDSVDLWISRIGRWLAYIQEGGWQRAKSAIGSGANSIKLTSELLKLSSFTSIDNNNGVDLAESYTDDQLESALEEAQTESIKQQVAIAAMRETVEDLNREYKLLGELKYTAVQRSRESMLEQTKLLEKQIGDFQHILVESDKVLLLKERQVISYERMLVKANEKVELKELILKGYREEVENLHKELDSKQASFAALRDAQKKESAPHQTSDNGFNDSMMRLRKQWQANTEQQIQNEFISREIRKLEIESRAQAETELNTIARLKKDIEAHSSAIQAIREELAQTQHVSQNTLDEFEQLREKFFFSLAVCVKLQGELVGKKPTEVPDLTELYVKVLMDSPDHLEWNDWLVEQMFPGTPKSLIFGRRSTSSTRV